MGADICCILIRCTYNKNHLQVSTAGGPFHINIIVKQILFRVRFRGSLPVGLKIKRNLLLSQQRECEVI